MGALKWGLRVLVRSCPPLPTSVIILRRRFPLQKVSQKAQLQTIVHELQRVALRPHLRAPIWTLPICFLFGGRANRRRSLRPWGRVQVHGGQRRTGRHETLYAILLICLFCSLSVGTRKRLQEIDFDNFSKAPSSSNTIISLKCPECSKTVEC